MNRRPWLFAGLFVLLLLFGVMQVQGRLGVQRAALAQEQQLAAASEVRHQGELQRLAAMRQQLARVEQLERGLVAGSGLPGAVFGLVEGAERASGAVVVDIAFGDVEPVGGLSRLAVGLRGEAPDEGALVRFLAGVEGAGRSVTVGSVGFSAGLDGRVVFQVSLLVLYE